MLWDFLKLFGRVVVCWGLHNQHGSAQTMRRLILIVLCLAVNQLLGKVRRPATALSSSAVALYPINLLLPHNNPSTDSTRSTIKRFTQVVFIHLSGKLNVNNNKHHELKSYNDVNYVRLCVLRLEEVFLKVFSMLAFINLWLSIICTEFYLKFWRNWMKWRYN